MNSSILYFVRTRLTLRPGQRGTRKLLTRYGDRLVCVRYRYDERRKKRYETVELIVEETDKVDFRLLIQGAADGEATSIEDVGVDHGCLDVFVAEEFLDCPDVITGLEQVGGEGMTEGMTSDVFVDTGLASCPFDYLL